MIKILSITSALALAGCQSTGGIDVFCQTHRQSDFIVSASTVAVMSPVERRNALAILREGAARCGWKPRAG